jgi:hypothetical protein
MNIQNEPDESNPTGVVPEAVATVPAKPPKPVQITPLEFFQGVAVNHPDGIQCRVTPLKDGLNNSLRNEVAAR